MQWQYGIFTINLPSKCRTDRTARNCRWPWWLPQSHTSQIHCCTARWRKQDVTISTTPCCSQCPSANDWYPISIASLLAHPTQITHQFTDRLILLVSNKVQQRKFRRVPQLIAEEPIALHAINIQINIASLRVVRAQRKSHRVRTALGNAIREVTLLAGNGSIDLLLVQIRVEQLLVQVVQRDAANHVRRINDVAKRLGHFAAVRIAHHRMQKHLLEGQLAEQLLAEEHHASNPEEDDVVTGLEQRVGEERLHVVRVVGPAHHGEGEEARAEPRVEHVLVLGEHDLGRGHRELGGRLGQRLLLGASDNPVRVVVGLAERKLTITQDVSM